MRQGTGSRVQRPARVLLLLFVVGVCVQVAGAQISFGDAMGAPAKKAGHVALLTDFVSVDAGKAEYVELRFRVDPGYHINSHTPHDALLIPTSLKVNENPVVKLLGEEYPKGEAFQLGSGKDAMALDVYEGEFRVRLKLLADKGGQTMFGALHYQACDDASCFPPKTLEFKVAVDAK